MVLQKNFNRVKFRILAWIGRRANVIVEVKKPNKWYGSDYGGFYVNHTLLNSNSVVYSIGLGMDISFDKTIIENHQCQVYGFDPTPKSLEWLASQILPEKFSYFPVGIGEKTEKVKFNLPVNPDHVSGSVFDVKTVNVNNFVTVQMKSLTDMAKELGHTKIDVLKMDIEGSEYQVMPMILESDLDIKQILVETHARFFDNKVEKDKEFLALMNRYGYKVFGVSAKLEEISFIKE